MRKTTILYWEYPNGSTQEEIKAATGALLKNFTRIATERGILHSKPSRRHIRY